LRSEADPDIKKNALEGLKTIAHNNWQVMKDLLSNLQVFAFAETPIRKELIVSVEVGPFTQNYDHGIPIRRAAFELLQTLFEVGATGPDDIVKLVDAII
jgi:cullin-associated NEDD8-dissociated protein 1